MSKLAVLALTISLGGCLFPTDESSAEPAPDALKSPSVTVGQDKASDGLDHDVIRRYMRRNLPKIRSCYEEALHKNAKLAGSVTTTFEIAADGHVVNATTSGMPDVAPCVATVIRSIEFPKPNDGASVNVTYPFAFSS
ncbi:MAG TPA: AgmX/PglI C-terminal domain-containing protein [Kofleriaceae bacterium]|jgi:hypothetical protein